MENNSVIREHWDNFNQKYSNNWMGASKEALSERELGFVNKNLIGAGRGGKRILDIGVGNGRILQNFVENTATETEIFGLDISARMCEICTQKFKGESKIKSIRVCDVSSEGVCFDGNFDFVSAIRVVKYNKDWTRLIENVFAKMNKGGTFVFTVLNRNSLSRFADYGIPVYLTDKAEVESVLRKIGFKVAEMKSLSKLPAFLYTIDNAAFARALIGVEKILEKAFGSLLWGKEFFIAAKRMA